MIILLNPTARESRATDCSFLSAGVAWVSRPMIRIPTGQETRVAARASSLAQSQGQSGNPARDGFSRT